MVIVNKMGSVLTGMPFDSHVNIYVIMAVRVPSFYHSCIIGGGGGGGGVVPF